LREFPLATHAFVEAVRCGDIVAVRALLTAAPELVSAARKMTGESIVLPAVYRRRLDVAVLVAERTELDAFEAAAVGCIPRLVTLLDSNPTIVRERMPNGWTITHLAAFAGQASALRRLLDAGGDPHASVRDAMANTPLHLAVTGVCNPTVIELLIRRGATPNARAASGITPLHNAASRGAAAAVELLLRLGADPAAHMDTGQTPAMIASAMNHTIIARRLRDAERRAMAAVAP
jgi:Ankyrin repeats (3 copies)